MRITRPMTADALYSMPDDGYRYDLIKGQLKTMSPAVGNTESSSPT